MAIVGSNPCSATADFEISFQVSASTSIPIQFGWQGFFQWSNLDLEKLQADFKLRITAYRKALFKKKLFNRTVEKRQKIIMRMIFQKQSWRGKTIHE